MKNPFQGLQLLGSDQLPSLNPQQMVDLEEARVRLEDQQEPPAPLAVTPGKIKTGMELTEIQLAKLEEDTDTRIVELMEECGLNSDRTIQPDSFMGMRKRYQDSYDGDYAWRKSLEGIFTNSNFTKGTNKRYVRKTAAKMRDDLLGTSPFFAILPARSGQSGTASKSKLAQQIEKYIQRQVELSNVRDGIRMAQKVALVRNEAIVKTTFLIEATPYYDDAEVLIGDDGKPIKTISGKYIYKNDNFFADQTVEKMFRLEKEPSFSMAEGQYQFQVVPRLKQYRESYKNADCRVVDYRSFLCPLTAENIHKADCVVQLMDLPYDQVKQLYGGIDTFDVYQSRVTASVPVSGEGQAKEVHGEEEAGNLSRVFTTVPIAEVYRRVDADEDGEAEEVFMVFDMQNKKMIFWDYLHRHMEKRPFEVVPGMESVPNRWYAVGIFAIMEDHGLYIDGQFNRVNNADSKSETVRFRTRNSVKQWKDGSPVIYGSDETLDCEQGYDAKNPPLFQVNLAQPTEMGLQLMREMEQAGDLMFGSISAQDASASDLNQSKTATGILNLERVGDILIKDAEIDQSMAITAVMKQVVTAVLENLDPMVSIYNEEEDQIMSLNREEIRDIDKDIRLLLTRSRSVESITSNQQVKTTCLEYFNLTPVQQFYLRDIYINILKSLEVADADERLPQVTKEEMDQWLKSQSEKPSAEPKELLNYKDAPSSVKRQMEQASGYQPANEQEAAIETAIAAKEAAPEPQKPTAPVKLPATPEPPKPDYKNAPPTVKRQMEAVSGFQPATQQEHENEQQSARSDSGNNSDGKPNGG